MSQAVLFDTPGPRARRTILVANVVGGLVAAGIVALVLWKLGQEGQLEASRWTSLFTSRAWTNFFLPGLQNTIVAALYSVVLAIVFGLVFGLGRLAPLERVRCVAGVVL